MGSAYTVMYLMLFLLLWIYLTRHIEPFTHFFEAGFVKSSLMVGLAVTVSYGLAIFKPRIRSPVGAFLGDRMYMPYLNDFIVPKIGWAIAFIVDYCNRGIDFLCHRAVPRMFEIYSIGVRRIQDGRLERYVKIAVGFILLMVVISVVMGW